MEPVALLNRIVAMFPDFAAYWALPDNCSTRDDGSFTLHGVFIEFTHFFRERFETLPASQVAALGTFLSDCMTSQNDDLDNAAATCFVENIAGDECAYELEKHLTGNALKYYRLWSSRPE